MGPGRQEYIYFDDIVVTPQPPPSPAFGQISR
jgi:hypothetical protein